MRFSLLLLLVPAILPAGACGQPVEYVPRTGGFRGAMGDYCGMWKKENEVETLEYLLIRVGSGTRDTRWSSRWGRTPAETGASVLPEGLFFNGSKVNGNGDQKLFVQVGSKDPQAVSIDEDGIRVAAQAYKEGFTSTKFWEKHIEPLLLPK